jgi:SOS-response transcriptional repressor LexA
LECIHSPKINGAFIFVNAVFIAVPEECLNNTFMKSATETIFARIDELGLKDVEFAKLIGETPQTVNNWKRRGAVPAKKLPLIASVLKLPFEDLLDFPPDFSESEPAARVQFSMPRPVPEHARKIPIVSSVHAGSFSATHDPYPVGHGEDSILASQIPYPVGPRGFALRIKGDSMREEFHEGDIVVIDPDATAKSGEAVVAKRDEDEEATFKIYYPRGNDELGQPIIELVPLNEHFKTLIISAEHPGRIIGPMVAKIQGRRRFWQRWVR